MKIGFEAFGGTLVARVSGELDLHTAEAFKAAIDRELDARQVSCLVVNLAGVTFLDSSGVGAIFGRYRRLQRRAGRLVLARARPQVRRVLEASGVLKLVRLFDSEAKAVLAG